MSAEIYEKAFKYEMLIRKAYECPSGMKNGAHLCFMQNAMTMENGDSFAKHLGTFKKQFGVVQKYIEKALIKLAKNSKYKNSKIFFEEQFAITENSTSTIELMEIVLITLDEIEKYNTEK